jgi:hypothetical protein
MNCTINGTCQCGYREYHNISSLTCIPQKTHLETCSVDYNCRVDKYLECLGGSCQCISSFPTWSDGYDKCIVPVSYSELCYVSTDCDTSKSLVCHDSTDNCTCPKNLSNYTCDCVRKVYNEYYWSGTSCTIARGYNQTCTNSSSTYMCKTMTEGTVCVGPSPYKCKCPSLQYYLFTTSKCESQLSYNIYCPQADACRSDLGLSCQSNLCDCDTTIQFWNGTKCVNLYTYNTGTCSNDNQCRGNLICRTNGTSCNCPSTVTTGSCDCQTRAVGNEYYWNGIDCVIAGAYNQTCYNGNYTCQTLTELTQCDTSTDKCTCGPYGVWNYTNCIFCATNWLYQRGSCFRGVNNPTSISLLTLAMIPGACNVATARLAVITSADLSWFPNVPTTQNELFYTLSPTCLVVNNNVFGSHACNNHNHGIFCEYILV